MTAADRVEACTRRAAEKHSCLDPAASAAAERVAAIARHLSRAFDEALAAHDLDVVDYRILTRLAIADAGHAAAGELSRSMTMSTGAMTSRLDRLEAADLVVRRRDPTDRRAVLVAATPAGVARLDAAVADQAAAEARAVECLGPARLARLNALLADVLRGLEAQCAR